MRHRIAAGHISRSQLETGYLVSDLPAAADQPAALDWQVLGDYDIYDEFEFTADAFDGSRGGQGGGRTRWELLMSPGMLRYWRETFCDGVLSAPVTIETQDTTSGATDDTWRALNGIMLWYQPGQPRRETGVEYWFYPFEIIECYPAPDGPDLDIAIAHDGVLVVDTAKTYVITLQNAGDAASFNNIVITLTLDADSAFDSVSASGWTVTYSTDGESYSGTPPGDLTTVTHLRFTRALPVEAGAEHTIEVDIIPTAAGEIAQSVTVTLTGDGDQGQKADNSTATAYEVPVASFNAVPTSGDAPLLVDFTDTSTGDPDTWAWDIDDDEEIEYSTQNAQHTYSDPDTYTVRLTVSNPAGSDSATEIVTVNAP